MSCHNIFCYIEERRIIAQILLTKVQTNSFLPKCIFSPKHQFTNKTELLGGGGKRGGELVREGGNKYLVRLYDNPSKQ
jgi:hypothetical protein